MSTKSMSKIGIFAVVIFTALNLLSLTAHAEVGVMQQQGQQNRTNDPQYNQMAVPNHLVNLNTANQDELETLPKIGPVLAERIIQYRTATPFRSTADLDNVPGFAKKRLKALEGYVTV